MEFKKIIKSLLLVSGITITSIVPLQFLVSCGKNKTLPENPTPIIPNYSIALSVDKTTLDVNESILIRSSIESNIELSNDLYYQWIVNDEIKLTEINKTTYEFSESNPSNYTITLKVLDTNMNLLTSNSINITVKTSESIPEKLEMPTEADLHIEGNIFNYYSYGGSTTFNKQTFLNKLNEYGVLNSISLLAYMCVDTDYFINPTNFENIKLSLMKNDNFNDIEIKINASVKPTINSISNFGKNLPFSISEGWEGTNLNANDNIEFIIRCYRSNASTMSGQNKFDTNKIVDGISLSGDFIWNKLTSKSGVNMAYTSEFDVDTKLSINNKLIKQSIGQNRLYTPFVYYAETDPNYWRQSGYWFGQKDSIR